MKEVRLITVSFNREKEQVVVNKECLQQEHARKYMDFGVPMDWGNDQDGTKQTAVVLCLHLGIVLSNWKKIFEALSKIDSGTGKYQFIEDKFQFNPIKNGAGDKSSESIQS